MVTERRRPGRAVGRRLSAAAGDTPVAAGRLFALFSSILMARPQDGIILQEVLSPFTAAS